MHGDDFLVEGELRELRWFEREIAKVFTVKSKFLGPEPGSEKEVKLLNRTMRWEQDGISWEPDRRHIELLLEQLDMDPRTTSIVITTAVKEKKIIDPELAANSLDLIDVFGQDCDGSQGGASASPAGTDQGKNMSDGASASLCSFSSCTSTCTTGCVERGQGCAFAGGAPADACPSSCRDISSYRSRRASWNARAPESWTSVEPSSGPVYVRCGSCLPLQVACLDV